MKILYYSVHSVLEDDEIRMLKNLGHDVFPLGVNFGFNAAEPFRESIVFNEREHALMDDFLRLGCTYRYGQPYADETVLTPAFVALFDVVIVMHNLKFIERFWQALSQIPVIWRTIGQAIDEFEPLAANLKAKGMHIVRYSPVERKAHNYCGETALIRFGKNPDDYGSWTGQDRQILTFAHLLMQRYPKEAQIYLETVAGLPSALGGAGNEALTGHIGLLTPQQQQNRYRESRAYFYCSGGDVPYTLNFVEALMSGLPLVAFRFDPPHPYHEIPALMDAAGGMVASSIDEARHFLGRLLDDEDFARTESARSRALAIEHFSFERINAAWSALLTTIAG